MRKTYISPYIHVVSLVGCKSLLEGSMKVDSSNPVDDSSDIGFVKEVHSGNIWDDDWSD